MKAIEDIFTLIRQRREKHICNSMTDNVSYTKASECDSILNAIKDKVTKTGKVKFHFLVCTNENHDVVSIDTSEDIEVARRLMKEQYKLELNGNEAVFSSIDDNKASLIVSPGEYEYYWQIITKEI